MNASPSSIGRILALFAILVVCCATRTFALNPTSRISQYGHSIWRVQDGYFGGAPTWVTQTKDGFIWVSTFNGIFRFDAVRIVRWSAQSGEQLPSTSVNDLLAARDGSVWIGTGVGLAHLVNGRLTLYEKGWISAPIFQDRDGGIWFDRVRAGDWTHPLCQILHGEVHSSRIRASPNSGRGAAFYFTPPSKFR